MSKILVSLLISVVLMGAVGPANAHGWRGGYGGGWAPFAVGAVAGAVVVRSYYRPAPIYYGPPAYYYPRGHAVAFCPENGLYYPQTQACPSGWQRVVNY
ncbi:hypothetical protein [Polynucleobacter sp. UK-Kesae-W10]|uniref:hypothetical protein n=1 Tax=Polynucleobacter sp. UK-Kesae-W10 TaxID=1819738 RepID=UPI001C0DB01C|nr:hypothetical protein [Polynucleobacter sp. UK-Kesae-W10]MBU3578280.1 hypothetical protein [Polynucleobacter sp. UK-Kesae-W10]